MAALPEKSYRKTVALSIGKIEKTRNMDIRILISPTNEEDPKVSEGGADLTKFNCTDKTFINKLRIIKYNEG